MTTIYHLTTPDQWEQAQATGEYRAESLATEGFIHASTAEQVAPSANRYFAAQFSIVVLVINLEQVQSPVQWDLSPHSPQPYPHIYGPLNLDAVANVMSWSQSQPGTFEWPPRIGFV